VPRARWRGPPPRGSCGRPSGFSLFSRTIKGLDLLRELVGVSVAGLAGNAELPGTPRSWLLPHPEARATKRRRSDGFVRNGYSGGPVFNEEGRVAATVRSGTPSGGNNELVPIAAAIALIKKRGVRAGIDTDQPFEDSCFAFCRNEAHGVERWSIERPWQANSGEVSGGHNRTDECKKLMSAALVGQPDARIELLPGEGDSSKGMWEEVKTEFSGQVHYKYFCQGTYRSGPTFKRMQSPACGLWE
jgi:hypothetical protein